jgi:metal-responsive CopG/Arc/MetJ family transcriptional regulator
MHNLEDTKITPEQRYRKRNNLKLKAFQIDKNLEDEFHERCENLCFGRSEAITELIKMFIDGTVVIPATERQEKLKNQVKKII